VTKRILKDSTGHDPGESRQTEKISQAVNLLEGIAGKDRFVHPNSRTKVYFCLICYLTQWKIYALTLNHKAWEAWVIK
jgi:hypothetical protein